MVEYGPSGVVKKWHKYSDLGGSSANLINVLPNAPDGSERVFLSSGVYIAGSGFVMAL